jgi:chemotaxis signal transduction protein
VTDELSAFVSGHTKDSAIAEREGRRVELLVFRQGDALLGIEARWVDSIIPFRAPALLPLAAATVAGVVQDRGRVVVVCKVQRPGPEPTRIIVCSTEHGLIGVPASATRAVGEVIAYPELTYGEPIETSDGVMTVLDPATIARDMSVA